MLIEFKGDLTGQCKRFMLMKQWKMQAIVALVIVIIFVPPVIVVSVCWKSTVLLFLIPILILAFLFLLPPGRNSRKSFMPKRIFIDPEDETIVNECEKLERFHMISSVSKVLDYGEWYYLKFYFSDRDLYFVCQKSLITQGTLEDFEALFKDKIEVVAQPNKLN